MGRAVLDQPYRFTYDSLFIYNCSARRMTPLGTGVHRCALNWTPVTQRSFGYYYGQSFLYLN